MTRYRNCGKKKNSNVVGDISSFFQTHCEFFFLEYGENKMSMFKISYICVVEGDMGAGTWGIRAGVGEKRKETERDAGVMQGRRAGGK